MKKKFFLSLYLCFAITVSSTFGAIFAPAKKTFQELNEAGPFVISFGTSMSQTHQTNNTAHLAYMKNRLKSEALKSKNPRVYLASKDRIGYILRTLPSALCQNCKKEINPSKLNRDNDHAVIQNLVDQLNKNIHENLIFTNCPFCDSTQLTQQFKKEVVLTKSHQDAMIAQINHLKVKEQNGFHLKLAMFCTRTQQY